MTLSCETVLTELKEQVSSGFELVAADEGCIIVTPFVQPDLAHIEFVVRPSADGYYLSDEGDTVGVLSVNGLSLTAETRHELTRIARIHHVEFDGAAFYVVASADTIGLASQNLASAIQAASYLVYKRSHRAPARFEDEIETYLVEHRVKYQLGYTLQGFTTQHHIPFYFNQHRNILLEPITATTTSSSRNKAKQVSFMWQDLRRAHVMARYAVVIDDTRNKWEQIWSAAGNDALEILKGYSDIVLRWEGERLRFHELVVS